MTNKEKFEDLVFDLDTAITGFWWHSKALLSRSFTKKYGLFYPQVPETFHILYTVCHKLGITMTNDPAIKAEFAIAYSDETIKTPNTESDKLNAGGKFINGNCKDISKEKVERVFTEVFGYSMAIDPRTHQGKAVRKSNDNATHDGVVIDCPTEPQEGYVYQRVINNVIGEEVMDLRALIFKDKIPFIIKRSRSAHDRFDHTKKAILGETLDVFSEDEVAKILLVCKKFGLDYGELDTLRDNDSGLLYIVDVNDTPSGPRAGIQLTRKNYNAFIDRLTAAFVEAFIPRD